MFLAFPMGLVVSERGLCDIVSVFFKVSQYFHRAKSSQFLTRDLVTPNNTQSIISIRYLTIRVRWLPDP